MILDSRTPRPTPKSGPRAGHDGATRRKGSRIHIVDTLGHLLAAQVGRLTMAIQDVTGQSVELACVDQGYTGATAAHHGVRLKAVKLLQAGRGFVLLPRQWVVERSFAWSLIG